MMLQQNKILVCVQIYYGPSMIFLHMQIFLVGVLKGNLLVLFLIIIVCHIDNKTNENGVTWGHRRFLPTDHRFQCDKRSFDGNEEHRAVPKQLSVEDALHQLHGMEHIILGNASKNKMLTKKKKREHTKLEHNWKKKSIFFPIAILEYPYFASQFGCNAY